ncbi:MAG: glycosyltransferase family 9 protein [Kiritimatiellae bacterium]|nr:glycosyltransferase family 9 protein [Kiritimatiellia bacterium]
MRCDLTDLMKATDAALGPLCCRLLTAIHYLRQTSDPTPANLPSPVRRVLVIRPGGMGDMVLLVPVLRKLREAFPEACIDVACERRNVAVLALASLGVNALVYDARPLSFLRHLLAGEAYDVAIDTEQFHHFSAVFVFLSRAPFRVGFKINPRRNPLYTHLVSYAPDGPEGLQFMRLLQPLRIFDGSQAGYQLEGAIPPPHVPLPSPVRAEMEQILRGLPFVAIHAGGRSFHKRWEDVRFVVLAGQLTTSMGQGIVLVGDEQDRGRSESIAAALRMAGDPVVSLAGRLALPEVATVLHSARLFVGPDSGLAHLAVALGTPTVVLFGPSDPLKWGFHEGRHAIVRANLPCAPCFIFGYHRPCRTVDCMKQITVEDVMQACSKILAIPDTRNACGR